jgi:hypothetical protein
MLRIVAFYLLVFSACASATQLDRIVPNQAAMSAEWHWQTPQGKYQQLILQFSEQQLTQSKVETFRLNYSLSYPSQAISAYLSPRLQHAVNMINQYIDEPEQRVDDILTTLSSQNNSPSSQLLWEAYQQYTRDAFRHLGLLPCIHPRGAQYPCVRPNYSQLFYRNRQRINGLSEFFKQQDVNLALAEVQAWLLTIPQKQENIIGFSSPIDVLTDNLADSDERALLLAIVFSKLAPDHPLYMVYPASSIGSASPAWLTVDASSGIEGPTVMIDNRAHTLVSGSVELIKEMLLADVQLISDALY